MTTTRPVFRRTEFQGAALDLGSTAVDLTDYATTGLRVVCVGPSGIGKTNAGLLMAEQLAAQGWVSVLMDPEGEIEALYGDAIASPPALAASLERRDESIVVCRKSADGDGRGAGARGAAGVGGAAGRPGDVQPVGSGDA